MELTFLAQKLLCEFYATLCSIYFQCKTTLKPNDAIYSDHNGAHQLIIYYMTTTISALRLKKTDFNQLQKFSNHIIVFLPTLDSN